MLPDKYFGILHQAECMQSADLFFCSNNAPLIRRGEGCLINAGGED